MKVVYCHLKEVLHYYKRVFLHALDFNFLSDFISMLPVSENRVP